jgi:hypothetical protein
MARQIVGIDRLIEEARRRSLEGHEWAEVARTLGRSTDAARLLWTRALKKLRPLIENRL